MAKVYAVGDIHGCSATFRHLLMHVLKISPEDRVYCLGDYIDRGPDAKGVVDLILELREKGYHLDTIRGNHEQMFMDAGRSAMDRMMWMHNGARPTLKSFGAGSFEQLAEPYRRFFESTPYYLQEGNTIFVHAGLNTRIDNPFEDTQAMLWKRGSPEDSLPGGKRIVHGHTPVDLESIHKQLDTQTVNIDNGCVYRHIPGLGNLAALDVEENRLITVKNRD